MKMDFGNLLKLFQGGNKELVDEGVKAVVDGADAGFAPNNNSSAIPLGGTTPSVGTETLPALNQPITPNPMSASLLSANTNPQQSQMSDVGANGMPDENAGMPTQSIFNLDQQAMKSQFNDGNASTQSDFRPFNNRGVAEISADDTQQQAVSQSLASGMPTSQPSPAQVQQSPLQAQQQKLIDLQSAPIKKESLWKDVLTKVVLGANAALNPNPNNKIVGWGRMKRDAEIAREQGVLGTMQQAQDYNANQAIRNNQIEAGQITNEYNKTVKPAIAQSNILDKEADNKLNAEKFDFDREYKTIRNQLGERRANDWKEIKNTELELKARGLDQTDERIKLIEQALKDTKAGKELDNKTRVEIEKMRQEGANTRTNTTVAGSLKRQELTEASKKALQEIAGKEGKAKTAQTAVDRWMGNQVKQGINPTQDQIEEYRQYVLKSLQ